ncbi:MAG: VWA domain-containing protein [Candidatus Acidiferrales bacterium]
MGSKPAAAQGALNMDRVHRSRNLEIRWGILMVAAILFTLSLRVDLRPEPAPPPKEISQQAKISVTTDLVVLPVIVTDSSGGFVSGLRKENFSIYEEGRIQNVTLFAEEDTPVTVGLLVDHSQSMRPKLSAVITAVSTFAHSSNPEDEMFVVDFSDSVSVETLGGKTFTSDARILEKAVSAVSAGGQTALYDAVAEGLRHLELGKLEKKALIIVSDGGDTASRHKFRDVLNLARQAHAVIYSIGLVGSSEEENPRALERLCKDTGGIAFFPHVGQDISNIAKEIARDLREQYTLGYIPEKKADGNSFRKIAVRVDAPGRGKVRVRTRAGYLAPAGKISPS